MMPQHFQGQPAFPHLRHHTPSASPPINGMPFVQRGHTPQPPQMSSRPSSRNDFRRPPNVPQPGSAPGPQPVVNGYGYIPQPALYPSQPSLQHGPPPAPYQYTTAAHQPQMPTYMEEARRSSGPPNYPPQQSTRPHPSPPQVHVQQLGPQPVPHMSPPQPSPQHLEVPGAGPQKQTHIQAHHVAEPQTQPHASMDPPKSERLHDRPTQPGLDTSNIRKLPRGNQSGSIFTPIDDNRSILGQHLDSFHADAHIKEEGSNRSQSIDAGAVSRIKSSNSPPIPQRANTGAGFPKARGSISTIPEGGFTPPSRSNSLKMDGASRPRLRVQIPDEASDAGSNTGDPATTTSPRGTADASAQLVRRNGADAPRLPPPSPSTAAIVSAGATGPPNPFARPPPQSHSTGMNIDTPVSALPSRFLNNEFLPSPSSFYPDWNFRGDNSTTLPSPLNFATPVAGSGPSFLKDDGGPNITKRKSPDISTAGPHSEGHDGLEPKRIKVDS